MNSKSSPLGLPAAECAPPGPVSGIGMVMSPTAVRPSAKAKSTDK